MEKNPLIGKGLAVGIILLFVGTCITPAIAQDTEKTLPTSRGNWLYVGGSGPGNYSRIQDAINDASDGNTVFVYHDSSPYYENILVNKHLSIQGEDRNSTIVIVDNSSVAVNIASNGVNISEFTFISKNNLNTFLLNDFCVIRDNTLENISLRSDGDENPIAHDHIEITNNILRYRCQDFSTAIWLYSADYSVVEGNDITGCTYAINVGDARYSSVSSNYIHDCFGGISVTGGCFNRIVDNKIVNVDESGIECSSILSIITGNSVINATQVGIELCGVSFTKMYRNKMQNCFIGLLFYTSLFNITP